jgi:NADPH-dependent curcumin reductase CurA
LSSRIVLERRPVAQPRASAFRLVNSEVPELRDGAISLAPISLWSRIIDAIAAHSL